MHQRKIYATELLIYFFLVLNNYVNAQKDIIKYNCEDYSKLVLIATVDGSLTAIEAKSGVQCWKTVINKDTFMSSSLSKFKVYENGERVWIVPSFDGNLFTYDGSYIAPLFMNVDSLLSTSATLDSKASIVGGKLKNFHGLNRCTGEIYYKCNMFGCDYASPVQSDDILSIEEVSQTVNAFDFVGKKLSWHFRVGELAIKTGNSGKISSDDLSWSSQSRTFLIGSDHEPSDVIKSIKISLHSGLVAMANKKIKVSWMYQTLCPILDVWYVSGNNVYLMDPFDKDTEFFPYGDFDALSSSRLFLGTYKRQYFVKKSREPVLKSQYSTELSTKILHRADIMLEKSGQSNDLTSALERHLCRHIRPA
ncbi:eukaryotic translation initiation factor 2-alpha kinase-like [Uloborus diversus]|uniref:eukaryotic translation initiation factor 2-alpha kinase-like n=1 Tax=Uloborus diversus TaxID=327109 RepID=UPI0024097348|nr:eukaryotic translation initiation factor 2-alpha kinase-like [Uloborus diversus]